MLISSKLLREALEKGYQIEPKAFELINKLDIDELTINKIIELAIQNKIDNNQEKKITENDIKLILTKFILDNEKDSLKDTEKIETKLEVIKTIDENNYILEGKKGFEELFRSRYNKLLKIISSRPDYVKIEKISSINQKKVKDNVKISGLVMEKRIRRNNLVLTIDDNTGKIDTLVINKKIMNDVKQILLDSFVLLDIRINERGTAILNNILQPDVPEHLPIFSKKRVYAVLTSDIHVGSKNFLKKEFEMFVAWLNEKENKKEKEIIRRIKYIIIAGDSIDGIGVYPKQELDLEELNVKKQYTYLSHLLEQIPQSIEIIIIPGNHDPVRQALPQPCIPDFYSEDLLKLSNVKIIGNPSYISIHGIKILVYHGRSLDDVIATTPGLNFNRPALAMKSLLKARHLSPVYGGRTEIAPDFEDNLVIEEVPDIFHSGHIHTLDQERYRGTIILNSGTWQSQTPFQLKMGIIPVPAVIPIIDLSTLDVITKDFKNLEFIS